MFSRVKPCKGECRMLHKCRVCSTEVGDGVLKYPGALCPPCWEKDRAERAEKIRQNAKPGLIQVAYGVVNADSFAGRAFSYRTDIPVSVGDIVLVPATWLSKLNGDGLPQEATVVSLHSDYDGDVQSVIRLVRKKRRKRPAKAR
jgi:hypothetical protein